MSSWAEAMRYLKEDKQARQKEVGQWKAICHAMSGACVLFEPLRPGTESLGPKTVAEKHLDALGHIAWFMTQADDSTNESRGILLMGILTVIEHAAPELVRQLVKVNDEPGKPSIFDGLESILPREDPDE